MPRMGKERDLKKRTMQFALVVSDLCEVFPTTMKGRHVAGQLFRAGTAVAAKLLRPETERTLRIEAGELVAIFTQSQITARKSLTAAGAAVVIALAFFAYLSLQP